MALYETFGNKPNIVLFVAEDLDFEGLSCYSAIETGYSGLHSVGNPYSLLNEPIQDKVYTPTIEKMAMKGVAFDEYYCTAPVCTASRYSILTGCFPERSPEMILKAHGKPATVWFNAPIMPGQETLPVILQNNGYRTGIFGKWHNYPLDVYNEIYDLYNCFDQKLQPDHPKAKQGVSKGYQLARDYLVQANLGWDVADRTYYENPEVIHPPYLDSQNIDWVVEGAVQFIKEQRNKPFFAYVAVSLPHSRYSGERFANANPLSTPAGLLDKRPEVMPTREEIRNTIRAKGLDDYACEGLWLDEAVKAVYHALEETGEAENTCFVFTTDHPTAGKGSCHLGRIPLIFYWPGHILPQNMCHELLSEVDLAPTLLNIAGIAQPKSMTDGISFAQIFRGEHSQRKNCMMEMVNSRAIISNGYKYIANRLPGRTQEEILQILCNGLHIVTYRPSKPFDEEAVMKQVGWLAIPERDYMFWHLDELFPGYFDPDELYDLREDKLEQKNLWNDSVMKEKRAQLKALLQQELAKMPNPFAL